jgi:hypothetical protein
MKPIHIYFLLVFISISICNALQAQVNRQSAKFARRAILVDAFTGSTSGNSINWHQPLLIFKQKDGNSEETLKKGYLNASIGFGRSFFPEPGISLPHSLTLNISLHPSKNKARFFEMGYGGIAWQATDNNYIYSNTRHRNEYGGGLLVGYRSNGSINTRTSFVFRVNSTLLVHKDQAFGNFCLLDPWESCRKPTNKLVIRPLINIALGLGL